MVGLEQVPDSLVELGSCRVSHPVTGKAVPAVDRVDEVLDRLLELRMVHLSSAGTMEETSLDNAFNQVERRKILIRRVSADERA